MQLCLLQWFHFCIRKIKEIGLLIKITKYACETHVFNGCLPDSFLFWSFGERYWFWSRKSSTASLGTWKHFYSQRTLHGWLIIYWVAPLIWLAFIQGIWFHTKEVALKYLQVLLSLQQINDLHVFTLSGSSNSTWIAEWWRKYFLHNKDWHSARTCLLRARRDLSESCSLLLTTTWRLMVNFSEDKDQICRSWIRETPLIFKISDSIMEESIWSGVPTHYNGRYYPPWWHVLLQIGPLRSWKVQ